MTNKSILALLLLPSVIIYTATNYNGGSLAPVILAGSITKHQGSDIIKKYKRKDCPVCKGTGKYLSGDGIKMVDCGYCEPEALEDSVTHDPIIISAKKSPFCKCESCKCEDCKCKPKTVIINKL
jgi:hypothetical protein